MGTECQERDSERGWLGAWSDRTRDLALGPWKRAQRKHFVLLYCAALITQAPQHQLQWNTLHIYSFCLIINISEALIMIRSFYCIVLWFYSRIAFKWCIKINSISSVIGLVLVMFSLLAAASWHPASSLLLVNFSFCGYSTLEEKKSVHTGDFVIETFGIETHTPAWGRHV